MNTMDQSHFHNLQGVKGGKPVGPFGPFVPPSGGGSTGPSHPVAVAGEWMALAAIMNNFDSTNGLSMAWDDILVLWGQRVSTLSSQMDGGLNDDYNDLAAYVAKWDGKTPPDSEHFTEKVTELQVKYQTDQSTYQNLMQGLDGEVNKETQSIKDLGTVTQQGLQNASAILGIANNIAQQMAH